MYRTGRVQSDFIIYTCPSLRDGRCLIAEKLSGLTCPASRPLCVACGGQEPSAVAAPMAVHTALLSATAANRQDIVENLKEEHADIFRPSVPQSPIRTCKHLGTPQGKAVCSGCGKGKMVDVFLCNLLGRECTLTPSDGTQDGEPVEFCSTCELWEEIEV